MTLYKNDHTSTIGLLYIDSFACPMETRPWGLEWLRRLGVCNPSLGSQKPLVITDLHVTQLGKEQIMPTIILAYFHDKQN